MPRTRTPEAQRIYMRQWRRQNPLQAAAHDAAKVANARAGAHGATGRITAADVRAVWDRQPVCVGCGEGRGIDHVVAYRDGGANEPGNLQNLCPTCNSAKEYAASRSRARRLECRKGHPYRFGPSGKAWCPTCCHDRYLRAHGEIA